MLPKLLYTLLFLSIMVLVSGEGKSSDDLKLPSVHAIDDIITKFFFGETVKRYSSNGHRIEPMVESPIQNVFIEKVFMPQRSLRQRQINSRGSNYRQDLKAPPVWVKYGLGKAGFPTSGPIHLGYPRKQQLKFFSWFKKVSDAVGGAVSKLKDAVTKVGKGLVDGVKKIFDKITGKVEVVVQPTLTIPDREERYESDDPQNESNKAFKKFQSGQNKPKLAKDRILSMYSLS